MCMQVRVGVVTPVCGGQFGGQRLTSGVIPQDVSTFFAPTSLLESLFLIYSFIYLTYLLLYFRACRMPHGLLYYLP